MKRSATYLYGLARPGTRVASSLPGIEGAEPVHVLELAGLAALVSEVPVEPFQSQAATDLSWLIPRALRHEQVIETMRAPGPIFPVRFGSLFTTREALEAWAADHHESIEGFLDHVADKDEWSLKLSLQLGSALEDLAAADPAWAARARDCRPRRGRAISERNGSAKMHVRRSARRPARPPTGCGPRHAAWPKSACWPRGSRNPPRSRPSSMRRTSCRDMRSRSSTGRPASPSAICRACGSNAPAPAHRPISARPWTHPTRERPIVVGKVAWEFSVVSNYAGAMLQNDNEYDGYAKKTTTTSRKGAKRVLGFSWSGEMERRPANRCRESFVAEHPD